ncbi:MAG: GAF domain-containing protein [Gammaproteobacteria bacterium]|nr:GAF domain-containing protein [Gammaproteobacteria bacterium]
MNETVKLRVSEGASAARTLFAGCPLVPETAPLAAAGYSVEAGEGAVVLATPAEAVTLLAQTSVASFVLILWLDPKRATETTLLSHAAVAGVLHPESTPETVYTVVQSAQRLLNQPVAAEAARMLEDVLEIGRALAAEKDLDTLLSLILTHARSLTGADGSSIYTRDRDGVLYFRLWQNASTGAQANAQKTLVGEYSVAGYVARTGETVLLDDAYAIPAEAPYKFNPASDRAIGYHTRSLLTLPLTNKGGDVVGVLQLINRKDRPNVLLRTPEDVAQHVRPFDARSRQLAQALGGQAGVALENSMLYADIERLFEGFIKASVQAIEARDPTTAGHSFRVADFTERLAMAVDRTGDGALRDIRFSRDELREIRYAALLHDFGKVGVREDVLVKAKKLHPHQLDLLKQRFKIARLNIAARAYRRLFDLFESEVTLRPDDLRRRRAEIERQVSEEHLRLDRYLATVLRANEPTVLHAKAPDELREIQGYTFPDDDGHVPLLHDFEFSSLVLPKGSLSAAERSEIESHVSHTFTFLSLIPWTRDLAHLPEYAYAHHEKLDGTGYPRGLQQREIPVQSRMMAISDIYDALTAPDRPYKLAVPPERALDILGSEARAQKIDATLLGVFIESRAWQPET